VTSGDATTDLRSFGFGLDDYNHPTGMTSAEETVCQMYGKIYHQHLKLRISTQEDTEHTIEGSEIMGTMSIQVILLGRSPKVIWTRESKEERRWSSAPV